MYLCSLLFGSLVLFESLWRFVHFLPENLVRNTKIEGAQNNRRFKYWKAPPMPSACPEEVQLLRRLAALSAAEVSACPSCPSVAVLVRYRSRQTSMKVLGYPVRSLHQVHADNGKQIMQDGLRSCRLGGLRSWWGISAPERLLFGCLSARKSATIQRAAASGT